MKRAALLLLLAVAPACSGGPRESSDRDDEPEPEPAACDLAASMTELDIDAAPGALRWDAATGALLVVDDATFRILSWTESGAEVVAGIPPLDEDPAGEALGEIAIDAAGVLHVPRYGFGDVAAGAIFRVAPGAPAERIAGLSGTTRRVALTFTDTGTLLASADEADQASVLEVGAEESVLASGMGRAGGIARVGADVLVVDPELGRLSRVDTAARTLQTLAEGLPALDRIAASGTAAFATGFDEARDTAVLVHIEPTGAWTLVADLPSRARSVAVDDSGAVFVSLRNPGSLVRIACE